MHLIHTNPRFLVLLVVSLFITWMAWGSSFVAIHYTLAAMPPLLMMASRFLAAGAITLAIAYACGARPKFDAAVLRDALLIGGGMITVGMGATGWSAARLDSGIIALVAASAPLWIGLATVFVLRQRLHLLSSIGIGVGMAAMLVLIAPGGGPAIDLGAAAVMFFANAAWAGASIYAARARTTGSLLADTGLRMFLGGAMLVPFAAMSGEFAGFEPSAIGALAGGSLAYLVIASSICAFLAYEWLLRNTSSTLAATHAFVNPLVAVVLGALVLGEQVGARTLLTGVGVIAAVILLIAGDRRMSAAGAQVAPAEAAAAAPVGDAPAARTPRAVRMPRLPRRATATRPMPVGRVRTGTSYRPTQTPAFAARRAERPWTATDGMDALAIDVALDVSGL